jgi:hypothetical protein
MLVTHGDLQLMLRMDTSRTALGEAAAFASHLPTLGVSLRREMPEAHALGILARMVFDDEYGPFGHVVSLIAQDAHPFAKAAVIASVALGARRNSVTSLARVLQMSERSVQTCACRAGFPSPHHLLVWGQTLWCGWRLQRRSMTPKAAASEGGFSSPMALNASLGGALGMTAANFSKHGTFAELLTRFALTCGSAFAPCVDTYA